MCQRDGRWSGTVAGPAIVGRQFDAYEGRRIRIVVAGQVGWSTWRCRCSDSQRCFRLTIPGTFIYGDYTEIALYVDDDADDACDVGEPLWGFVTGIVQENLLVRSDSGWAMPQRRGAQHGKGCRPWPPPAGPCAINFQADLAMRLPCPG